MTVKELVLTSLENLESFKIDLGTTTKPLYDEFYNQIVDYEIESYYLHYDNDRHMPLVIIKLQDY